MQKLIFILITIVGLSFNQDQFYSNQSREIEKEISSLKKYNGIPASIVRIDENSYVFCDYSNIYMLFRNEKEIRLIETNNLESLLNPAGLFYDDKNKKLYVANYTKKNVLVFDYAESEKKFIFCNSINNNLFKGPEGVFVENNQLLVADYNGGLVMSFSINQDQPKLNWAVGIAQAHSVIKLNGEIYASSLTDRKIYKISESGAIINSTIGMGNRPPGHLWPVHLFATHNNELGVVDAHQGTISIYNNKLELQSNFGKNGPEDNNFNFPYSVIPNRSGYVMADSFRKRIIFYDKNFSNPETIKYGSGIKKIFLEKNEQSTETEDIPYVYKYIDDCRLFFDVFKLSKLVDINNLHPSFNGFASISKGHIIKQFRLDSPLNLNFYSGNNFYMTGCKRINNKHGDFYVFYSPQNPTVVLIDPVTWAVINTTLPKSDLWGEEVVYEVLESCKKELDDFIKIRDLIKNGVQRVEAYNKIVLTNLSSDEIAEFWKKAFCHSVIEKKLSGSIMNMIKSNDIDEYVLSSLKEQEINLIEALFISYIIGKPIFDNISELDIESKLNHYNGHEINKALNYTGEAVYTSALEQKSDYAFMVKGDVSNGHLVIDWMDEHTPEKITITVYNDQGQVIDVICTSEIKKINFSDLQYKKAVKLKIYCHYKNNKQRLLIKRIVFLKNFFDSSFTINNYINKKYRYTYDYTGEHINEFKFKKNCEGHCGNFALALSEELEKEGYKTITYDLKAGEAIHSVVEVYDSSGLFIATFDPTLNLIYLATVDYFIKSKHEKISPFLVVGQEEINPKLMNYQLTLMGQSGLSVVRKYSGYKNLKKAFQTK